MILAYYPDDGPPVEFDFNPGLMVSAESEAVEDVGGAAWKTFEEWGNLFFRGSLRARRAALWIMLRKTDPKLKFQDLSFRAEQVTVGYSEREQEMLLAAYLTNPDLDDQQREHLKEVMSTNVVADTEVAMDEAGIEREPDPKDLREFSDTQGLKSLITDSVPDSESATVGPWQN